MLQLGICIHTRSRESWLGPKSQRDPFMIGSNNRWAVSTRAAKRPMPDATSRLTVSFTAYTLEYRICQDKQDISVNIASTLGPLFIGNVPGVIAKHQEHILVSCRLFVLIINAQVTINKCSRKVML